MGESNGIIINEEEGYGVNFQRNHYSPEFMRLQNEGCEISSSSELSPLGLKLKKSKSLLDLVHEMFRGKNPEDSTTHDIYQNPNRNKPKAKNDDSGCWKASNFHASLIMIGSWKKLSRHAGDLTAKVYYAKRKIVWEVLEGTLKSKMEIEWSQITAIRASMPNNQHGILEIELSHAPSFYGETSPQPRRHTLWHQICDFTGGQASTYRRHTVIFPPGILDKHYEKLLQFYPPIFALSLKPFPSLGSPFFDPSELQDSSFSLNYSGYASQYYPHSDFSATKKEFCLTSTQNSTVSDVNQPYYLSGTQNPTSWKQGTDLYMENGSFRGSSDVNLVAQNDAFTSQNYHSNMTVPIETENHLLGDPRNYQVEAMHSSHGLSDPTFSSSNWRDTGMNYQINDNDEVSGYVSLDIKWMLPQDSHERTMIDTMDNNCSFNPFSNSVF